MCDHTDPDAPQCCDGTTEKQNTFGLICSAWYGIFDNGAPDKGCCKTNCVNTIQCCGAPTTPTDLTTSPPTNLACKSWKGTWSSGSDDKGCCKCDTNEIFGFDNGVGTCCPNTSPVFSYSNNIGHCCQSGYRYSEDTNDPDKGDCCVTGREYSWHENVNPPKEASGGCCLSGHVWDGNNDVCVRACTSNCCDPDIECCKRGNVGRMTCDPGEYLKAYPDCTCKDCNEKYACEKHGHVTWVGDSDTGQCNVKPFWANLGYVWKYTEGEVLRQY